MQKFEDSFEAGYSSSDKKATQGAQNKKTKIVINVAETQYAVVKHVSKKLRWNMITEPITNLNFDICWIDGHVRQEFFARMQAHQKINHFPGMTILSRKNNLGKSLMTFRKKFPNDYEFFPITWNLPADYADLLAYHECRQQGKAQTFIVKPEAGCQGRGIHLTRNIEKFKNEKCVIQRYMHKPLLIDDLKFDLRIYVLVAGIDPLRIFVYEEGLARFATEPYKPPRTDNLENKFMHLTNYAVNKESPNFIFNESPDQMDVGHKRSLSSIYKKLADEGHDVDELKRKINDIFIKTIITGYPTLSSSYMASHSDNFSNDMCFEILGFDIMIDHKLNPSLIEINYTPSFTTDTPLDKLIKKNLIHDTLNLLNINDRSKKDMKTKRDKEIQERMVTGKRKKYTNEERKTFMAQEARKRDEYEKENMGGYTKIFLLSEEQMNDHKKFYDFAFELFNSTSQLPSMSTFSAPINSFPYYKHYFEGNTEKSQTLSTSFYKSKKVVLKDKNSTSKISGIVTEKKTREEIVGGSQGRRVSSAKPKVANTRKEYRNDHSKDKVSVKASSTRNEEEMTKEIDDELILDNASIFTNKKLEGVGIKKRRSETHLTDSYCNGGA